MISFARSLATFVPFLNEFNAFSIANVRCSLPASLSASKSLYGQIFSRADFFDLFRKAPYFQ